MLTYVNKKAQDATIGLNNNDDDNRPKNKYLLYKKVLSTIDKVYHFLDLVNFIMFLIDGRYYTIYYRICKISFTKLQEESIRFYDFNYLNRTIVWSHISSFVFYVLPMFGSLTNSSIGQALKTIYQSTTVVGSLVGGVAENEGFTYNCKICKVDLPVMPRVMSPCSHVFCYCCLEEYKAQKATQQKIANFQYQVETCPFCDVKVLKIFNKIP